MNQPPPDSSSLPRRSVLRSGIMALFGLYSFPPWLTKASSRPPAPRPSIQMDAMTALMLAKTALDIVQGFSKRPDGLGAMLRYQIEMLGEISRQLNSIQKKLNELESVINRLPEDMRLALKVQFRTELLHTIAGAAELYRLEVLEPSREDPSILSHVRILEKIKSTHEKVSQNRATLMQLPEGIGPNACLTAPVALALEVACAAQLGDPPVSVAGKLNGYSDWLTDMLSQKPRSIPSTQRDAALEHDRQITTLADNFLAQRLNVNQFLIAGDQSSTRIGDPCIIIGPGPMSTNGFDSRGGTTMSDRLMNISLNWVKRFGWIESRLSQEAGAMLLSYNRSAPTTGKRFDGPQSGEYCYYHKHQMRQPLSSERSIAIAGASTAAKRDDFDRTRLEQVLARVNEERARIAFCSLAMAVAYETQHQINEYRTILYRS